MPVLLLIENLVISDLWNFCPEVVLQKPEVASYQYVAPTGPRPVLESGLSLPQGTTVVERHCGDLNLRLEKDLTSPGARPFRFSVSRASTGGSGLF